MPRLPRIQFHGAIYFITSKGAEDQQLFRDKADYKMYLELLSKYKSQHKFRLYSYCLLEDRIHLLIESGDDSTISEVMHDLHSLYTKYFNARYERHGHLFESRFKSTLVEKANYLLEMTRHLHTLPAEFQNYPYSSYRILIGETEGDPGVVNLEEEVREIRSLLSQMGDGATYEKYCLTRDAAADHELEKKIRRGGIVGSDTFAEAVKDRLKEVAEEKKEETPAAKPARTWVIAVGLMVLVIAGSSVYLYVSKKALEKQYAEMLRQKETEFNEKSKFGNRNPLSPTELEGTRWEIDLVPGDMSQAALKDNIRFTEGRFSSDTFASKGFRTAAYFLVPKGAEKSLWQSAQSNARGDTLRWQGEWQGEAMKGSLSFKPAGQNETNFSFFSKQWSYQTLKNGDLK